MTTFRWAEGKALNRFAFLLCGLLGCSATDGGSQGGDDGSCGGKCDDAEDNGEEVLTADVVEGTVEGSQLSCDLTNRSKAPNQTAKNLRRGFGKFLHDPVAEIVLRGGSCPRSFEEVMLKLAEFEPECGNRSAIVSETAQASTDDPSVEVDYRAVTTRFDGASSKSCLTLDASGSELVPREPFELLFSTFGYAVGAEIPQNAELIGFDRTRGVFNYYTVSAEGEWAYFGGSEQYARIYRDRLNQKSEGPFHGFYSEAQLEEAQADETTAEFPRCAGCHTGGGLVMKELNNPWLHWDTDKTMPGVSQLFTEAEAVLGSSLPAPELERTVVRPGNEAWNDFRINNILADSDAVDLLTPLFCTVEVNLQTGDRSAEGGKTVSNWPDFLVNTFLLESRSTPAGLSMDGFRLGSASYTKATGTLGQEIGSLGIEDTFKRFVYSEASHADQDYLARLRDSEILPADFIDDVLAVDVTRPIFSDDRCVLLEHVPADLEIPASVRDRGLSAPVADRRKLGRAIVDAVGASLAAIAEAGELTEPEEALLANMEEAGSASLDETLTAIGQQCSLRANSNANAFHLDMLRVAAARRHLTRHEVRFIEFGATMPDDDFWGADNDTEKNLKSGLEAREVFFDAQCRIED